MDKSMKKTNYFLKWHCFKKFLSNTIYKRKYTSEITLKVENCEVGYTKIVLNYGSTLKERKAIIRAIQAVTFSS